MKVIDSDNYAASGIETFFFPGGEPHARIPENFGDALLFLKPRTWNDVGIAACVLNALRYQGEGKNHKVWLFCPYLPGARQDRTDYRTPVTREVITRILGKDVNRLYVFDVHSRGRFAGVHIEHNFMPSDILSWVAESDSQYVIAPDKGAANRALNFADHISDYWGERYRGHVPVIQADKKRNFSTGKFDGFTLPALSKAGHYIVVDDICDGGGTFNLLAEAFLRDPLGEQSTLSLWVSHGIFSKGVDAIHPKYRSISTTDSWCQTFPQVRWCDTMNRLYVVPLKPVIDRILEESDSV